MGGDEHSEDGILDSVGERDSTPLSSVEQEMVLCLPPLSVSSGAMRPPPPLVSIMRAW